jgi:hypothetical protein
MGAKLGWLRGTYKLREGQERHSAGDFLRVCRRPLCKTGWNRLN